MHGCMASTLPSITRGSTYWMGFVRNSTVLVSTECPEVSRHQERTADTVAGKFSWMTRFHGAPGETTADYLRDRCSGNSRQL
jgi:hypothetical protein